MGLITRQEMRELEAKAFRSGISAESLMDKAGKRLGEAIRDLYPISGTAVAYVGKGNNGGDALVALKVLRAAGWKVSVRCSFPLLELGILPRRKLRELGGVEVRHDAFELVMGPGPLLLIDGLLGIGSKGPMRDPIAGLAAEMNALRDGAGAEVVSVDIPSGVDPDNGRVSEGAVRAGLTATIGVPKKGLVEDLALDHVGRIEVIPLEELPDSYPGDELTTAPKLRRLLPPRDFDTHKGQAGRVGIVAGSRGMLGAGSLSALGALRGGAGLVTLYVLEKDYLPMVSTGVPPEVMVRALSSYEDLGSEHHAALVIGPGLGCPGETETGALLKLLECSRMPLVVDADGLNLMSAAGMEGRVKSHMVLTPHPGEMERMFPEASVLGRADCARAFVGSYPCTLLYKGSRTIVTSAGEDLHYNVTGNPGMASGGQGDVLSGVLGALLASGMTSLDAARSAAWLAGRASEIALEKRQSQESLLASDTANALGEAFRALRGGR